MESDTSTISRESSSPERSQDLHPSCAAMDENKLMPSFMNTNLSQATSSSELGAEGSSHSELDSWISQMAPIDIFQRSVPVDIVDANNPSSYLNVIQYHFEGRCIIVS